MYCKCNETFETFTTHVVNYSDCIIIVKNVPCVECVQCGERYFSDEVASNLEKIIGNAKKFLQEVPIVD